jgi:hypothetical protein
MVAGVTLVASASASARAGFSSAAVAALPPGTQNLDSPSIVVNSVGERVVLVAQTPGPCMFNGLPCLNAFIQPAPDASVEGPQPIGDPLDPAVASLATRPDGTVTAVWVTEGGAIRFADRPPGGSFDPSQLIDATGGIPGATRLLQDPAGDLMLVVESDARPTAGILVAMRRAGERTFGPLQMIPATTEHRGFVAAISNAGDAIVAWIDLGSASAKNGTVRAASCSISTSTCAPPVAYDAAAIPQLYSLAIAANPDGAFVLAWQQIHAQPNATVGSGEVRVIRGTLSGLRVISDQRLPARASTDLHVAIDAAGITSVLWQKTLGHTSCKCNEFVGDLRFVAAAPGVAFTHTIRLAGPHAQTPGLWLTPTGRALISWSADGRALARLVEPRTRRMYAIARLPAAATGVAFDHTGDPIVLWSRGFRLKHRHGTGTELGATAITPRRPHRVATHRFATPSYGAVRFATAHAPGGATAIALLLGDAPGYVATEIALSTFTP